MPDRDDGPEVLGLLVHVLLITAVMSALGYTFW